MTMKYKLIIFDLDGTLLDTLEDLTDAINYALRCSGYPEHSLDAVRGFVGNGIRKLVERAVPEHTKETELEQVFENFREYYQIHCADKTKPYAGIEELLRSLREKGYKLAVVSNKADSAVQVLCQQYFGNSFDFVVGERTGIRKKPAPDSVLETLSQLKLAGSDAVYVGDSEVDIQTAANAAMECVIVDWGFRDREFLIQSGAKHVISSPEEIWNLIAVQP